MAWYCPHEGCLFQRAHRSSLVLWLGTVLTKGVYFNAHTAALHSLVVWLVTVLAVVARLCVRVSAHADGVRIQLPLLEGLGIVVAVIVFSILSLQSFIDLTPWFMGSLSQEFLFGVSLAVVVPIFSVT